MTESGPTGEPSPPPVDRLRDSVVRFERRRRKWATDAGRVLIVAVAVTGVGWVVVIPAVAGFALGHALDARFGAGVTFAAGLGLLGLVFGCWSAWRRIAREREEHGGERR